MYGGRILKPGKTVDHYQIKDGCTVHLMPHKKKREHTCYTVTHRIMA